MSYICPVCNGLKKLSVYCPECAHPCEDEGRFNDFLGPYAPYRPIDDIGMTNGYLDVRNHLCTHVMNCPNCGHVFQTFVPEWQN